MDNLSLRVGNVDFAGPDYKQDTVCAKLLCGRFEEFIIHKVHFAVASVTVKFAFGEKFLWFAEPAVGVVSEHYQRNDIRHTEISGGAEDCVELVKAWTKPLTGLKEIDVKVVVDFRPAVVFAVEMIKIPCIQADYRNGEGGNGGYGRGTVLFPEPVHAANCTYGGE